MAEAENTPKRDGLWLLAILVVTFLVYAKTLSNEFVYDDKYYAAAYTLFGPNTMVLDDHPIGDYFTTEMGHGVIEGGRGFRPLTVLSYATIHQFFRERVDPPRPHPEFEQLRQEWTDPAWPQHLVNVLLHVLGTALTFLMVRAFTGPGPAPLLAAAVFGLHALRSDAVCSVVGRGELLPFVCGAGATLAFARLRAGWSCLAAVLLLSALLCKESAVAWIVMVPLFALCLQVRDGEAWRGAVRRQLPHLAIGIAVPAVVFGIGYANFLAHAPGIEKFVVARDGNELFHLSLFERLPTAVHVWAYSLYKTFVPIHLAHDYGRTVFPILGYGDWRFWLSALVLLAVLAAGLRAFGQKPLVFLAVASFLGFGFVTSNIPVPIETIFGERLCYTPALGLSFLVAALALARRDRRSFPVVLVAIVLWCAAAGALAAARSFDWQDNPTLFERDAENQPRSLQTQLNMARLSIMQVPPDWDRREQYLQRMLAADPTSLQAIESYANDLLAQRRFDEAEELLQRAVAEVRKSEKTMQESGLAVFSQLGLVLARAGKNDAARQAFEAALAVGDWKSDTNLAHDAWLELLSLAWQRKDAEGGASLLGRAARVFPRDPKLQIHRGLLAHCKGSFAAAATQISSSLRQAKVDQNLVFALRALADSYVKTGYPDRAAGTLADAAALAMRLQEFATANELVRRGLGIAPRKRELLRVHVWLAWSADGEATHEVRKRLQAARAIAPNDSYWDLSTGMLALRDGDAARAAKLLAPALNAQQPLPEFSRAWLALAEAFLDTDQPDLARSAIETAYQHNRQMPARLSRKFLALAARLDPFPAG